MNAPLQVYILSPVRMDVGYYTLDTPTEAKSKSITMPIYKSKQAFDTQPVIYSNLMDIVALF